MKLHDVGDVKRIPTPIHGWELGLVDLVLRGICPWCVEHIRQPRVKLNPATGIEELTWDCAGGCNP